MTEDTASAEAGLSGRWRRVGAPPPPGDPEEIPFGQDPAFLPGEVEFFGSRYRATKAIGQPFIVWDVGTYELEDGGLTITLANDASATYPIELGRDEFTVTGTTGYRTVYQRVS